MTGDVPILSLNGVDTYYGDSHILHNVNFEQRRGEVIALLGRNGVGKTTTIHTILGMPPPRHGSITFQGQSIAGLPTFSVVQRGIGWVPQGHRIFPTLSVVENLELAVAKARTGRWTLAEMYRLFPRLDERRYARGDALSGGEQQMLAIARALVQNPDLILMDEPSEGLSPRLVQEVEDIIVHLHQHGVSILLVEQNLHFALAVAQRVLIMNKGAIVFAGGIADIANNPALTQQYLGVSAGA